jgi:hypothetical protein
VTWLPLLEGTNGQTTITDSAPLSLGWVAAGAAALSTTHSKFGTTSLYLGTIESDLLAEAHTTNTIYNSRLNLGAGPFTLECFFYRTGAQAGLESVIVGALSTTSFITREWQWSITDYTMTLYFGVRGQSQTTHTFVFDITKLPNDQWNHIAITRDELTIIRSFAQGVYLSGTTYTDGTDYTFTTNKPMSIGGDFSAGGTAKAINCYIDQLRITRGVCRYRDTFTPPAAAFTL